MEQRVLYPTLTRPILVKGVPRDWAILCCFAGPFTFFFLAQLLEGLWPMVAAFSVFALLWVVGYFLAKYWDPEFLSVLLQKRLRIGRTVGPSRWTGNRYWG